MNIIVLGISKFKGAFSVLSAANKSHVGQLDGIRGLAALLVVLSHLSFSEYLSWSGIDLSGIGKTGVYLFFFLSAYLLTRQFIEKPSSMLSKLGVFAYVQKRVLRIYPLFAVYLLMAYLSTILFSTLLGINNQGFPFPLSAEEMLRELLLVEAKGVEWSIIVEFKYYCLIPLIGYLISRATKLSVWALVGIAVMVILLSQTAWPPSDMMVNDRRLGPYLPVFLTGSLVAALSCRINTRPLTAMRQRSLNMIGWFGGAALIVLTPSVNAALFGGDVLGRGLSKWTVAYAILISFIVVSAVHGGGWIEAFFRSWFLRFSGAISFGIYLWHWSVIKIVNQMHTMGAVSIVLIIAMTIIVSAITFVWIEYPAMKLGHRKRVCG